MNRSFSLDSVTFELKEEADFHWLKELGRVIAVFDQQDSGNISFGVEKGGVKRFVKYAGARTVHYDGEPEAAVERLRNAMPVYEELKHPCLIELLDHFPVNGGGYTAVFEWFEGENLHPHWVYPPPAKYTDPNSPFYKYKNLPVEQRLASLDSIFRFHAFVEKQGFAAVDFYDGSLLYDFNRNETKICDIDYYCKLPFTNEMGRMWGSSRFMAPEEFELGAIIDSRTNVFRMGAIAFGLLGGELDRSAEKWDAGERQRSVARRAVEGRKQLRFSSVEAFYDAWLSALAED
ncbi:serine/threonine protein kinase [Paenibacillus sp. NPDC058071]|uniref:serine/threonine protein kinase n=1 Tax=Paenibacillus sp. NPDC058071 TaxID=3346326 RepID=UPI0036DC3F56